MKAKRNPKNESQARNTRDDENEVAGGAAGDQNEFTVCPFQQRTGEHAASAEAQQQARECSDIKTVLVRFH